MTPDKVWVVYDNRDSLILSVHPYIELAERYKNHLLDLSPAYDSHRYIIGTLDTILQYYISDMEDKLQEEVTGHSI